MLTSDLTSLVPLQFSPWLQVRKIGTIHLSIYHLSSRVQLAGSLKSAGSEVLVEPLVISTLLNRLSFRCLIMYMKKLRASDWLKTGVSNATRV